MGLKRIPREDSAKDTSILIDEEMDTVGGRRRDNEVAMKAHGVWRNAGPLMRAFIWQDEGREEAHGI